MGFLIFIALLLVIPFFIGKLFKIVLKSLGVGDDDANLIGKLLIILLLIIMLIFSFSQGDYTGSADDANKIHEVIKEIR